MKKRFKMFRRKGGMFYARDTVTLGKQSLGTTDRVEASRLLAAKNQAVEQPSLNKGMAKVYLSAASPECASRTWTDVMEKYVTSGTDSSKAGKERAFRRRPFVGLHKLKLIDTSAEHLYAVLEHRQAGKGERPYRETGTVAQLPSEPPCALRGSGRAMPISGSAAPDSPAKHLRWAQN